MLRGERNERLQLEGDVHEAVWLDLDVAPFEVPVHDVFLVRGMKRRCDLPSDSFRELARAARSPIPAAPMRSTIS